MRLIFYINTTLQGPHMFPIAREAIKRKYKCVFYINRFADEPYPQNIIDLVTKNGFDWKIISTQQAFKAFVQSFDPNYIIYADTGMVAATKLSNYRSVQIFHGISLQKQYMQTKYEVLKDEVSDIIFASGIYIKNKLLKYHPEKKDNIHIVGFTKFDNLPKIKNDEIKTILYAPTWDKKHSSIDYIGSKIVTLPNILDCKVIVKLHDLITQDINPGWADFYKKFYNVEYIEDSDIIPSILKCDIMISDYSSCIFEALTLGKPVIAFTNPNLKPTPNTLGWDWRGLTYEVKSFQEIEELLLWKWPLKLKPQTKKMMSKLFYKIGGASKRILDILEDKYEKD